MTETTYWTPHSRFETIPRLYFHPTLTLTTKRSMLSPGFLEICARALLTPRGSRFCPQVIEALGLTSSFPITLGFQETKGRGRWGLCNRVSEIGQGGNVARSAAVRML
jgi:hypothetical protein